MVKTYKAVAFRDLGARARVAEGIHVPGLYTEASTMKKLFKN